MALNEWNQFDDEEEARRWVGQQMVAPSADSRQWLIFLLDGQLYGLPISYVVQMVRHTRITPIPNLPPFLVGAVNLQGEVIPVMDLRLRFAKPAGKRTDRTILIIVCVKHPTGRAEPTGNTLSKQIGLMVDAVSDLLFISNADLHPPDATTTAHTTTNGCSVIMGVVRQPERVITLLEMDILLSQEEMIAAIAG